MQPTRLTTTTLVYLIVLLSPSRSVNAESGLSDRAADVFRSCKIDQSRKQCFAAATRRLCPADHGDVFDCENELSKAVSKLIMPCLEASLARQSWDVTSKIWNVTPGAFSPEMEINFTRGNNFLRVQFYPNAGGAVELSLLRDPGAPPTNPWGFHTREATVSGLKASTLPGFRIATGEVIGGPPGWRSPLPGTILYSSSARKLYGLMVASDSMQLKDVDSTYSVPLDGFRRLARQLEKAYGACGGELE